MTQEVSKNLAPPQKKCEWCNDNYDVQRNVIEAELYDLRAQIERIMLERDDYQQELFESNRYAAMLSYERQNYIDRIAYFERDQAIVDFQAQISDLQREIMKRDAYILNLELIMWDQETERIALINNYIQNVID